MWFKVSTPEDLKGKSPEEMIQVCSERLREIYQQSKPLQDQLKELDKELLFWWKLKRQEILKLIQVKRIPPKVSGRIRETIWKAKPVDLSKFLSSLSQSQRDGLIRELERRDAE
jgi:hypothetical protein